VSCGLKGWHAIYKMRDKFVNRAYIYYFIIPNIMATTDTQSEISNITIQYSTENQSITLIDPIEKSEEFKKLVWQPYMKELYDTLLERSTDPPIKGLNKFAIHSVSPLPSISTCLASSETASLEC
jgi:hypothetical protein